MDGDDVSPFSFFCGHQKALQGHGLTSACLPFYVCSRQLLGCLCVHLETLFFYGHVAFGLSSGQGAGMFRCTTCPAVVRLSAADIAERA